jgi:uncharacterized glyoxalase superfamily protein PhnB
MEGRNPRNADALYAQALGAGAITLRPMAHQPFSDRSGTIRDPFGHPYQPSSTPI